MRKILSLLLFGLGGFLLVAAVLLMVWVPGQVKRTPLDTDSTTRLSGQATHLSNPRGPVEAISKNRIDGSKSTDDVAVFNVFTCLVKDADNTINDCVGEDDPKKRLITAGTDVFAADRKSAESLKTFKGLPNGAIPHQGLVNKFPFDTEKKTYPMWDGVLRRSVPATFQAVEQIEGLETYKFLVSVKNQPATISSGVQGTYSSEKTMWIDPVTGAIQKQQERQIRKLPDGSNAIDLDFQFTPETVKANVEAAKDNGSRLSTVGKAPWILLPLALLALVGGFLLGRGTGNRRAPATSENTDDFDDFDELDDRPRSNRR